MRQVGASPAPAGTGPRERLHIVNETQVTMIGNAVEDPVLRFGKSGQPFVTFRLASTVRRRDPGTGEYVDVGTNFVTVLAFRQLARNVAESLRKGQPVVVSGRLRVNQWQAGERTGTSVEIDATTVGHDLSRGIASFTRVKGGTFGEGSFPMDTTGGQAPRSGDDASAAAAERDAALVPGGPAGSTAPSPYDVDAAPDGLPPYDDEGAHDDDDAHAGAPGSPAYGVGALLGV